MTSTLHTRIASALLAGLIGIAGPHAAAAQARSVAPVPPAPPAPPARPAPPAPPALPSFDFDIEAFKNGFDFDAIGAGIGAGIGVGVGIGAGFQDFNFDKDEFKLQMDEFKDQMEVFKDSVKESVKESMKDFKGPERFAFQNPRPVPTPPPPPPAPNFNVRMNMDFNGPSSGLYDSAHELINSGRYEKALEQLDRLIRQYDNKTDAVANRVDAALYWKAYVQLKESTYPESLATLGDLQKRYADSRWIKDARALEVEVRQASGQSVAPEGQNDEELKLLALRGLMQADPDRALPQIEQIMSGSGSVRLKENALFVLSQSKAPRARDVIGNVAKSNSNPDVQLRAIRYLGSMRAPETRQILDDVYRSTSDVTVKRAIIQSYSSNDNLDRLADIARNEKDVQLRRTAVRTLGGMRKVNTSEALKAAYLADNNVDIRKEVIRGLANQNNAITLVELARQEKNSELKQLIVQNLGGMKSKEATDYLVEILK